MTVTVNGDVAQLSDGTSIVELLHRLGRDPQRPGTAVARNGEVVRRAAWPSTSLAHGDRVEVLNAVGGG